MDHGPPITEHFFFAFIQHVNQDLQDSRMVRIDMMKALVPRLCLGMYLRGSSASHDVVKIYQIEKADTLFGLHNACL